MRLRRRDAQAHQHLAPAQCGLARRDAERFDRQLALSLRPGDDANRAGRDQRGDRIGGGRCVAEVAAKAGSALNLRAADKAGRLDETGKDACESGIRADPIARHRGTDAQAVLRIVAQLVQLGDALDIDEQIDIAPPLTHLDDDIRPAGQRAGAIALGGEQCDGLAKRRGGRILESIHARHPVGNATVGPSISLQ